MMLVNLGSPKGAGLRRSLASRSAPQPRARVLVHAAATTDKKKAMEQEALKAFKAEYPAEVPTDRLVRILKQALATGGFTSPQVTEGAALVLEQRAGSIPVDTSLLEGKWRIVFSTFIPVRPLQYIPIPEYLEYDLKDKKLAMTSFVGPLITTYSGDFTWDGAKMDFSMPKVRKEITLKPFAENKVSVKERESKAKSYTFYYVDNEFAAARTSAGGVTLLYR